MSFSSAHSSVLSEMNAWKTEPFSQTDFFEDDPIHLTIEGHKRLAGWFVRRIETADEN